MMSDIAIPIMPLLIAPIAGSCLGVLIVRLPAGRPVAFARSTCNHCHCRLKAYDMVPLLSYALLRGRCRQCGAPIGRFHPAIELAAAAVALWAMVASLESPEVWITTVFGWILLTLGWIDWEWLLLPDVLTLPLLLAGLAVCFQWDPQAVPDHLAGAAAGYLSFRLVSAIYRSLRHNEGLGHGDAKLFAAAGAWLGWQLLPWVASLAAVSALAVTFFYRLAGRPIHAATSIPFGTFLAFAMWLVWLYGDRFVL